MTASLIAANVAAALLIAVLAYAGWHTIAVEKRRRRKMREHIRLERAKHEDLCARFIRAKVRCDLLKREWEQAEPLLFEPDVHSRKVPEDDRLSPLSADDFALLAGDVR